MRGLQKDSAVPGTKEGALRTAISAAAAVDTTGLMLKKWALQVSFRYYAINYCCSG